MISVSAVPPEQIQQMIHRRWQDPTIPSVLNITSFAQTTDGYLWIGTRDGLIRFDGLKIKHYRKIDTPGLFNDDFQTLLVTRDQTLYCGTVEGGLVRVKDQVFRSFIREDGLSNRRVAALAEHADGTIYIGTRAGGVLLLRKDQITQLTIPGQGFFDVRSMCLVNGEIWMGSGSESDTGDDKRRMALGDLRKNPRTGGVISHWDGKAYHVFQLPDSTLTTEVTGLVLGPDGLLYIATSDQGVFSMHLNSPGIFKRIEGPPSGLKDVRALTFDATGAFWVALGNGMVARSERSLWSTFSLVDGVNIHSGQAVFQDKEGTVWVGTTYGLDSFYFGAVTTFGKPEGLADDQTTCVIEDEAGQIWVGTENAGLSMISSNGISNFDLGLEKQDLNKSVSPVRESTSVYAAYPAASTIQCLAPAKGGGIWFGTTNGFGKIEGGVTQFYSSKDGFPEDLVWSIYQDDHSDVWIGMTPGIGLYRFRPGTKPIHYPGTKHLGIRDIAPDGEGGLWLATQSHGIVSFRDGAIRGAWSKFRGLSDDSVRSLFVETNRTVWVGTRDRGLNRFLDGKIDKFRWEQGFGADQVSGVVRDDSNNLWMGTPRGILRASIPGLDRLLSGTARFSDSRLFTQIDGMRSEECRRANNPTVLRSRDGLLWFTTQKGLSMVDPKRFQNEERPLPVQIESIAVDNIVKSPTERLVFEPGGGPVRLSFTATALRYPSRVRFRYKLSTVEPDWVILPSSQRDVIYQNLRPGNYTFSVQAVLGAGEFDDKPAVVAFAIPHLFYQTPVFYGSLVACFLTSLVLLHQFRLRFMARRASTLKAEVLARTAELRAEIIERQRAEDQLRLIPGRILQAQEGERRRVAAELHDSVSQLLGSVRFRLHLLEPLSDNEPRLGSTLTKAKELLDISVQEVRRIARNLRPAEIDDFGLKAALENAANEFRLRTRLQVELLIPNLEKKILPHLELPIYRITQEALTNIERHAEARNVKVELAQTDSHLVLTIHDDGKGFSTETITTPITEAPGIGLLNIRDRAEGVGGNFSINSSPGHGTEVTVQFPLTPLP